VNNAKFRMSAEIQAEFACFNFFKFYFQKKLNKVMNKKKLIAKIVSEWLCCYYITRQYSKFSLTPLNWRHSLGSFHAFLIFT
jgi:hypothetical protein